jgi:hypothetical protein
MDPDRLLTQETSSLKAFYDAETAMNAMQNSNTYNPAALLWTGYFMRTPAASLTTVSSGCAVMRLEP